MPTAPSLVKDHWLMRRALNALEVFVQKIEKEGEVDRGDLQRFATFFRVFGDELHAEKEEEVLLPQLERAGFDWQQGPLARARREHRQERYFMRVLAQLANQENDYDSEGVRRVVSELRSFLSSMRAHLKMEDEELFPLLEKLSSTQADELEAALKRFEESATSAGAAQSMTELAEDLIERHRS